ncbi:hypothetical protein HYALB_00006448 [Hymenoscyphus albidus]|uniref:Uncharacterized protein n=1 Tax=Hymenoscyphus albidus TaxID=595503 RepID=A0A9N9LII7_9HELO|nr:hypothetical protein HYALB_00006448 [Hymenoscyphus albidus]
MESTLKEAQPTNDFHHDPFSSLGFLYIKNTYEIIQTGHRQIKLAGLVHEYPRQPRLLDLSMVNKTIQVFARELGSLLPDDIHCDSLLQSHEMENTQLSLMMLFNHILGECEDDHNKLTEIYHRWIHRVEPEALIQSLIMAAVKGWVFETDCSIFSGPKEKPLLSKYQEIIQDCSSWDELRNLDIAAHYCLMETRDFCENVISHKASELACNLSKILAPLFIDPLDEIASTDLESWGHSSGTVEERKFRIGDSV